MTRNGQRLLLLIDDEPAQRRLVSALAARTGWRSVFAADGEMAIATLGTQDGMQLDAILLDHWGSEGDAAALITELRSRRPALPILVLTANGSAEQAVSAMRAGATDFLVKPLAPDRLLAALDSAVAGSAAGELRPLTEKMPAPLGFDEVVGSAPAFRAALAIAAKAARARIPVLIEGESGVGKEVLAEAIHAASPRARKPMIRVNCGAIPANLVESELFGHERGGDRERDHRHGDEPRHDHHRRGRGDGRAARLPAGAGLPRIPGLPVQQAAAGRAGRGAGAQPSAPPGGGPGGVSRPQTPRGATSVGPPPPATACGDVFGQYGRKPSMMVRGISRGR